MKTATAILVVTALLLPIRSLGADDPVRPVGYDILSQFELSDSVLAFTDTLVITRRLVNNESFPLTGLYLSENFPPGPQLVAHSATLNSAAITYDFDSPLADGVLSGYDAYYWVIDDPSAAGSPQNEIQPNDTLLLQYRLSFTESGQYNFPLHTAAFYGNGSGFFSADEQISVEVQAPAQDTTPPGQVTDLQVVPD